jgi:hypothetical protein
MTLLAAVAIAVKTTIAVPVMSTSVSHGLDEHGLRLCQRHLARRLSQACGERALRLRHRILKLPLLRCEQRTSRFHQP